MSAKSDQTPAEAPSPIGEISQEPSAFETFLDANQKRLVIIGILAILILIGYVIYDGIRKMGIENDAATVAAATTVPEYEEARQEVGSTNAQGSALLLKSRLLWNDLQKQEATSALQEFISSYPGHPALGSAYAKLGSYQQQQGNLEEAKAAFQKAAETESAVSSLALLSLGDLARQAGQDDEARGFYDQIIAGYEESHFQVKTLARQRLELIGVTSPVEKAPEPVTSEGAPNPGAFSAPVGLPGASPDKPGTPATDTPEPTGTDKPSDPGTPAPTEEGSETPAPAPADGEATESDTPKAAETTETAPEAAVETPADETPASE